MISKNCKSKLFCCLDSNPPSNVSLPSTYHRSRHFELRWSTSSLRDLLLFPYTGQFIVVVSFIKIDSASYENTSGPRDRSTDILLIDLGLLRDLSKTVFQTFLWSNTFSIPWKGIFPDWPNKHVHWANEIFRSLVESMKKTFEQILITRLEIVFSV